MRQGNQTLRDLFKWATRLVALPMAQTSQVEGRLMAILQTRNNRNMLNRKTVALAALVAIGVVLPLATLRPSASAQVQQGLLPETTPPHYAITELAGFPGVPAIWDSWSGPHSINDRGQIAGAAPFPARSPHSYSLHAVLWDAQGHIQGLKLPDECSAAWHLNNAGQVVGEGWGKLGGNHIVLSNHSHIQILKDLPGGRAFLVANHVVRVEAENGDINDSGQIVLNADQKLGYSRAYVYGDGRFQDLGLLPGGHTSQAQAINNLGQVVGQGDTNREEHAFLWKDSGMTDLGVLPGFDTSAATGVNAIGQVIGTLTHSRNFHMDFQDPTFLGTPHAHGFFWQDGRMQDLGTLPRCDYTLPTGINDKGQIVGDCYRFQIVHFPIHGKDQSGTSITRSAFFWQNGRIYDLSQLVPANWQIEEVRGINSRGQIVGIAGKNIGYPARDNGQRAVLLTPQ